MSGLVKIKGLAEAEKNLFKLGSTSTARRVGQRTLLTASEPMVAAIKSLAPDDPSTTPSLKDTIKAQVSNRNRKKDLAEVLIGIDGDMIPSKYVERKRTGGKKKGPVLDLGAFGYGVIDEFGSEHQAAKPYFRPGFDATVVTVTRGVGVLIGPEIERAAARLAKRQARAG